MLVFINLILLRGDIIEYQGTEAKSTKNLSVCHWKVNSINSHNFQKLAILMSFVAIYKLEVICISEAFNTY